MQLRQSFRAALALSFATLAAGAALQSSAATGTGTATAVVVRPLAVENSKPLVFGAFEAHGGAVSVATTGDRAGDASALVGGGASAGEITVRGEPNATYSISGSGNTMVDAANGASMAITDVRFADAAAPEAELTVGLLRDGAQVLKVGATLAVDANQAPGSYAGTYSVTVNYN